MLFRSPISLALRLFGNMYAGELVFILIAVMFGSGLLWLSGQGESFRLKICAIGAHFSPGKVQGVDCQALVAGCFAGSHRWTAVVLRRSTLGSGAIPSGPVADAGRVEPVVGGVVCIANHL